MPAGRVIDVLSALETAAVRYWVDGGWGIDALVGEQTRVHQDLDLVVGLDEVPRVQHALAALGFRLTVDERPTRCELHDGDGRKVGLHTVSFDPDGGRQVLQDGTTFLYEDDGLTGRGRIAGVDVSCLTADLQIRCHLGYEPDEGDFYDMHLLRDRLGISLPAPYDASPR